MSFTDEKHCQKTDVKFADAPVVGASPELVTSEGTPDKQLALVPDSPANPKGTSQALPQLGERYQPIALVGQGAMGSVWKVRDKAIDKTLAIKLLKEDVAKQPIAAKRFEQEAEAAALLTHANFVAVYGHDRCPDGTPFIIMDYLDGESLADVLKREGFLPTARALNILIQVCEALVHAHQKGLVHRDIKPSNIFILKNEQGLDIVKLVDFGIAKIDSDVRSTQTLTHTGEFLGTPAYMSPEQCLGMNQDMRSDIYEFGCTMYETLTGDVLFSGDNPAQVIAKHLSEKSIEIPNNRNLSRNLQNIIASCVRPDPADRYPIPVH